MGLGFDDVFDLSMSIWTRAASAPPERVPGDEPEGNALAAMAWLRQQHQAARATADLEQELRELRFALSLLIQIAGNSGAIDMSAYQARVKREVEESRTQQKRQVADTVPCANGGHLVHRGRTVITVHGTLCDQCHHTLTARGG